MQSASAGLLHILLGWFALVGVVSAELSPRDYLDRMSYAFREQNYRGVFTYEYGAQMESMRIVHAVTDGVEQERLVYLNGEPREFVRDGHKLSCVHPGDQILRLGNSLSGGPFARTMLPQSSEIENYYRLSLGKGERVAGRETVEVKAAARDAYRYNFRLFIDKESGLLLKSLTVASNGRVLERFQFADIEIGVDLSNEDFSGSVDHGEHLQHHLAGSTKTVGVPAELIADGVNLNWLPTGFTVSARSEQAVEESQRNTQLVMYSDGFSTVTVVLEPVDADLQIPADGKARRGATVAYIRPLEINGQPYLLTVVGEVPLMTAQKIARNVTTDEASS